MSSQNNQSWREEFYSAALLGVLALFSVFLQQGKLDIRVRDDVFLVLSPVLQLGETVRDKDHDLLASLAIIAEGGARLAQLEHENTVQQIDQQQLQQLQAENDELRQKLGRVEGTNKVSFRLYGSGEQWFLDGGLIEGLHDGQVVTLDDALVGVITQSLPHTSELKTLTSESWQVPVKIGSASAAPSGVYRFTRGYAEVRFVTKNQPVEKGQPIRTLGDSELPPNLFIGWVEEVMADPDGVNWDIVVKSTFLPNTLDFVEVDKNTGGAEKDS